jgi:hypothetical protein
MPLYSLEGLPYGCTSMTRCTAESVFQSILTVAYPAIRRRLHGRNLPTKRDGGRGVSGYRDRCAPGRTRDMMQKIRKASRECGAVFTAFEAFGAQVTLNKNRNQISPFGSPSPRR